MTNPSSHIRVSVEETENGYIVQAGSAVARISRTILGYAVDADSQVLKEEYNLSPGVEKVRKSAHTAVQFSADPTDETRLILRTQRNFLLLSQAVEMVCGFPPKDFPRESDWKLLSAWKNERDVVVEPEHAVASQIGETTTPAGVSSGEVQEEFGTTLQDIVSEVEDAVDAEYQSNSWRVIPYKSAEKFLDKSAFEFHETGVPKDVCDFFGATNLPAGSRKEICLINNSKRLTGYIIKDITKSERVKLRWDDDVSDIISRYRKKDGDKLSLVFFKMLDLDTYNIIVRKVVGANPGENNTIPSVVEETRSNTESDVLPSQNIGEEYSPDVLRIHEAVSKLPRYRFDDSTEINVKNGLLVVFEDGEKYGEYDRIVYVGINKKSGRLPGRVQEFISGKKDGVVLRKYIGEALLLRDKDPYVRIWAKDASSPEKLRRIGTFYDPKKEAATEIRVSSYLKEHMSFSVIEINNSKNRTLAQNGLVTTLKDAYSQYPISTTWLGRYNPDLKIRTNALWMKGNDQARPFSGEELGYFLNEVIHSRYLQSPSVMDVKRTLVAPSSFKQDSLTRVTVSSIGSGYVVNFRDIIAKITPVEDGYSLEIGSQIFNKDLNLSDKIRTVREAIRLYHSLWKEVDTNAEILTLRSPFIFPHISDALETICGYTIRDVPSDSVFKTLPSWIGFIDDDLKDGSSLSQGTPKETPPSNSDSIEKTYYSWDVLTSDKVRKKVDKSCLDYRGSAIPIHVRSFFHAENLMIGDTLLIYLYHNGEYHTGKITANVHGRVRIFWSQKLGAQLQEYCDSNPTDPTIIFERRRKIHTYSFSFESGNDSKVTTKPVFSHPPVNESKIARKTPIIPPNENRPKVESVKETEDEFLKEAVIIEDCLVKKITQTVITSKKFVLPSSCLPFFAADDMKPGEARRITVKYGGKEGQAQIYKNNASKGKYAHSTTLTWNDALNAYIKQMARDEENEMYFLLEKSILDDDTYRLRIEKIS